MVPPKIEQRQAGFSLLELLVVIAIVAVMAAAGAPAITALVSSGNTDQNLWQLSGILEEARQYAVSKDTYVWVAFAPATSATGIQQISVAVLASKDGTDPAAVTANPWPTASYGNPAASGSSIALVNKIVTLKQVSLEAAGTVTSINSLPSGDGSLATNGGGFFNIALPGTGTSVNFTQAIEFTPAGQAQNAANPVSAIDLDVQPQKGNVEDRANVAVLRINGLTGETVVYRP